MTFRSLQMAHYQLIIPRQGAWDAINQLGQIELAHVIDSGDPINRPFFNQLKRCDQALQKVNFLTSALKNANMQIIEFDDTQDEFFENLQEAWKDEAQMYGIEQSKLIDKFESEVMDQWQRYQDISTRIDKLKQNKKLLLEKLASIQAVQSIYQAKDQVLDQRNDQPDFQGRLKGVSFIVGVVPVQSQQRLTRMIYRVSMGYAFMKTVEHFKMKDLQSFKQKVVLVMYPNSEAAVLERKIKRVMETFCVNNFMISQQSMGVKSEKDKFVKEYEQVTNLLNMNENQMSTFLQRIKSVHHLENWRIYFWKERHLYSVLDKMEVRQQFFRANIYVPQQSAGQLSLRLNRLVPSPSLHQIPNSKPPTAFKVTQYTAIAQQITNTYGIPRYQQINPTMFTVVTFPFFFGVMFGDIAHGGILFTFGLFLIFNEQSVKKGMLKAFVSMKYIITMMGFFSFYCGWIYNDFIGMNINVFGSCYDPPPRVDESIDKQNIIAKGFDPISENCIYPIGVDPIWGRATNELVYINALKMKVSVIIAIIHMTLGVIIKAYNSTFFKKKLDFYFEFLPQIVFLVILFGYMDFLIIFKWLKQSEWKTQPSKAPSIISTMMNIGLKLGKTSTVYDGNSNMWGQTGNSSQDIIQLFILLIAFICVPLMLLPKPLIEINQMKKHKAKHPLNAPSMEELQQQMEIERQLIPNKKNQDEVENKDQQHEPSQIFVHQLIETIQFVLGTVSNTASYLRLWALSLAHSQLAKVFFEKLMVIGYNLPVILSFPMFLYGFYALCWVTFGVLMCMDTMQCFLHSLRLHWVQFQNKFYKGDGYKYQPFSFKKLILENKSLSD